MRTELGLWLQLAVLTALQAGKSHGQTVSSSPVPQPIDLDVKADFGSQSLIVTWRDGYGSPPKLLYNIVILWTEQMKDVYNEYINEPLNNGNQNHHWLWTSPMPLECTSHSVKIRACQTWNHCSNWSQIKTIQGFDILYNEGQAFPTDKVVAVGTNLTFCCVGRKGQTFNHITYEGEKLDVTKVSKRTVAAVKYNLTASRPSGSNAFCSEDVGTTVFVGYPPDDQNLVCDTQDLKSIQCHWSTGRLTKLSGERRTKYNLSDRHSGNMICPIEHETPRKCKYDVIPGQKKYHLTLRAVNPLGSVEIRDSLDLYHRVRPHAPNLRVEHIQSRNVSLVCGWTEDYRNLTFVCQVELKSMGRTEMCNYTVAHPGMSGSSKISVGQLHPFETYSVRVRCGSKQHFWKWGDWSRNVQFNTAEERPGKALDIWRTITEMENGQEVVVMWKPLNKSETKGTIIKYSVTCMGLTEDFEQHHNVLPPQNNKTLSLNHSKYIITVHAVNSLGDSPPANITVPSRQQDESITPSSVSSVDGGFELSWSPEANVTCGYIVDWHLAHGEQKLVLDWMRVPSEKTSAVVRSETFKAGVMYIFSIYGCTEDGEPLLERKQGYVQELAPAQAVNKLKVERYSSNEVLLQWEHIPVEKQRGFIRGYYIYVSSKNGTPLPVVINITNPDARNYTVKNLHTSSYDFTVKAYTAGGTGNGATASIYITNASNDIIYIILASLSAVTVFMFVVSILCYKKRKWVMETFYPVIPIPQIKNGEEWGPEESMFGNKTLEVRDPCTTDAVCIIRDGAVEVNKHDTVEVEVPSDTDSSGPLCLTNYPQLIHNGSSSSDTSAGSMDSNGSNGTEVTYTDIQSSSGSPNAMQNPTYDLGYKPQVSQLADQGEVCSLPDLPLLGEPMGYQPQASSEDWQQENPEAASLESSLGSPTSINSTQFLLPDQPTEDSQEPTSSSTWFHNFLSMKR
ncbi:LIF receptor subunit alpha a [Amia ocellicauda]|uniref:LIF receptor subunit alpha a n=1 Tax=Amia ocellicauda TaxID=2972642 RepID=UPI003463FE3D